MTVPVDRWLEILHAPERERLTVTEVCRRYGISRKSYYSRLTRYRAEGVQGLAPRSCRPRTSPGRCAPDVEAAVVRLRLERPRWGARRIRAELARTNPAPAPALSTVHAILRRHGLIGERWQESLPRDIRRAIVVTDAAAGSGPAPTSALRVNTHGTISYRRRKIQVGAGLAGEIVRVVELEGVVRVYRDRELVRDLLLGPEGVYHGNGKKPTGRPPRPRAVAVAG